jgi:alpha-galactosidase
VTNLRMDHAGQTVVVHQPNVGLACIPYWGAALPLDEDLEALVALGRMDVTGGMMDANAPLSVCPEVVRGWPGQPGMIVHDMAGRSIHPDFKGDIAPQVCPDGTGDSLGIRIEGRDAALGVSYSAEVRFVGDMLALQASLSFDRAPHVVTWLSAPVLPVPSGAAEILDFSGRWIGEFQLNRTQWKPGVHLREARLGRSGHEHPPFAIVTSRDGGHDHGATCAFGYASNGGHRMVAEELPDGRHVLMFGPPLGAFGGPANRVETSSVRAAYSDRGTNGTARMFQREIRRYPGPKAARQPRPVHYNCWEAIYFDHDEAILRSIADRAADLGAERFVLDDGWFGRRDDDTSSLGDWETDPRKWPNGLRPFAEYVNRLGMGFGLWIEPEMVNLNSDLYRTHPEWMLGPVTQTPGRQQYVLDMSRAEVRAHLADRISAVLETAPVDYVKWDHNRLLPFPDDAQTQGALALWSDLTHRHPQIEFESCASGGGRIDLAMFTVAGRVWLSDSNDALERLRIQHDAALFLPVDVTGSHVGPRHCHTSGRTHEIRFRAWVAAQRHMGFEMDPRELTDDEVSVLKDVTAWWKGNRHWRMQADILRLDTTDLAVIAEIQIAQDGDRFVVFAGQAGASSQILPRPLQLTGLDAKSRYRVTLRNADEAPRLSRGTPALKTGPLTLSGQALMRQGMTLPWRFPDGLWVLEGERL